MKFLIIKHYKLDFLGTGWEECYIDFSPLTIADVKEKLPEISKMQEKDANPAEGIDLLLGLLDEKFIKGKAVGDDGKVVDLPKESLKDLPIEVIGGAFAFLSARDQVTSTKP